MIKNQEDQRVQMRERICGGQGIAKVLKVFEEDETFGKVKLFDHVIIPPGVSFGPHAHKDDVEIYFVLKGEIISGAPGQGRKLGPGDASITGNGEVHYLENVSNSPAELLAIIVR